MIKEEIVEATWQEVGSFSVKQAKQGMMKLGARQADLLTFVTVSMDELRPKAIELGTYVFFVVYRMFETSSKVKLKRISAYEKNEEMLQRLEGAHDRFFERIGEIETSNSQNSLMSHGTF